MKQPPRTLSPAWTSLSLIVCLLLEAPSCSVRATPAFRTLDEDVYEAPVKTQITQKVLLEGSATSDELRTELIDRYEEIVGRAGFQYHVRPNSVGIHIYGSEEQANSEFALWVAMLVKSAVDSTYKITVREERLEALSSDEAKHGLSETTRKSIYSAFTEADRRAEREATTKVPDSKWHEQGTLAESLSDEYRAAVRKKHKLTEKQASEISREGLIKGWP